jgi:predicted RNase H-like HicB family nuclease
MGKSYTAVIKQDGDWWIGWVEEIPGVNCQEKTREELLESLKLTLKEALEMNKHEALSAAGPDYSEVLLKV